MLVKTTVGVIKVFKETFDRVPTTDLPFKVGYAISRNYQKVAPMITAMTDQLKPGDKLKNFVEERSKIEDKYALKDDSGKIVKVMDVNNRPVPQFRDLDGYMTEFKKLQDKYPAYGEFIAKKAELEAELRNEIEIELHGVKASKIPETLPYHLVHAISMFIIDDLDDDETEDEHENDEESEEKVTDIKKKKRTKK